MLSTLAVVSLVVAHVAVVDVTRGALNKDQTVEIEDGRIASVRPSAGSAVPEGAQVVDGSGKFLIPGLWDMHVHTAVPAGESLLGLYIANGVTGVRDMGSDLATNRAWSKRIEAGTLIGPRIVASGPYLQGGDAALPHYVVRTPDEGRAAIDSLARSGADFVKLHEMIPPEAFFAVARAARERGLVIAGHLQTGVTNEQAVDSGQRSLEHLKGFPNSCSRADSVRLSAAHPIQRYVLGECSTVEQTAVYRYIATRSAWVTPTIMALEMMAALPSERLPSDTLVHYIPKMLLQAMAAALEIPSDMPADANAIGRALYRKQLEVVGRMARSGVRLLAGTDAPLPNSVPGFGLHSELEGMVAAGLTPWEALRTATIEPSRYFAADSVGRICVGCVADLVVLEADPRADIRNTRRISMVVARGKTYGAKERAAMKTSAITAAR